VNTPPGEERVVGIDENALTDSQAVASRWKRSIQRVRDNALWMSSATSPPSCPYSMLNSSANSNSAIGPDTMAAGSTSRPSKSGLVSTSI